MPRVSGEKYSSSILSGYKTKEEAEQFVLSNYSLVPEEIRAVGQDFVAYFKDPKGEVYKPTMDEVPQGQANEGVMEE